MGRLSACALAAPAVLLTASGAAAQTHVGANREGGLHWSVAAPGGASWSLVCRFAPVTYEASRYDRRHWANRMTQEGRGPARGRLPSNDGRCFLTKTGGDGPVGLAMVKDGVATADGARDTGQRAAVGVF